MEKEEINQRIVVVGDGPTCTGFRLAGVQETYPKEGKEAEEKVDELMKNQEVGIIIVNEKIMEEMDWRIKRKIDRAAKPVVVSIPDKDGPMQQTDSLQNMIKKALGFDLSKQ